MSLVFVLFPVAPGDYTAANMMEFMFTNEGSQTLTVMTSQDTIAEGDETLSVVIDGITGPAIASSNLPLTITDDDSKLFHSNVIQ